uniref:Uncharacterized protein n=1 Tax=Phlebotomus papatasi TaxID=29031 RepID=A0A1B0DMJ8_PHLPP
MLHSPCLETPPEPLNTLLWAFVLTTWTMKKPREKEVHTHSRGHEVSLDTAISDRLPEIELIQRVAGICPGNRLRVVQSYDSGCCSPSPISSPCPSIGSSTSLYANHTTSVTNPSELYENTSVARLQKHGKRRSWHIMPNKVSADKPLAALNPQYALISGSECKSKSVDLLCLMRCLLAKSQSLDAQFA